MSVESRPMQPRCFASFKGIPCNNLKQNNSEINIHLQLKRYSLQHSSFENTSRLFISPYTKIDSSTSFNNVTLRQQSWGGILILLWPSVRLSVGQIVSALCLPQYQPEPFHIYRSYQSTLGGWGRVSSFAKNSKLLYIMTLHISVPWIWATWGFIFMHRIFTSPTSFLVWK